MLRVKDIERALNRNMVNVIYENHWTGQKYDYVDEDSKVELILPVDKNTIKISISI